MRRSSQKMWAIREHCCVWFWEKKHPKESATKQRQENFQNKSGTWVHEEVSRNLQAYEYVALGQVMWKRKVETTSRNYSKEELHCSKLLETKAWSLYEGESWGRSGARGFAAGIGSPCHGKRFWLFRNLWNEAGGDRREYRSLAPSLTFFPLA